MKSILVFPPVASPTYVPFGLALLGARVNRSLQDSVLELQDLNISFWHQAAENHPKGASYLDLVQNRSSLFFDPQAYAVTWQVREQMLARIGSLSQMARHYVETDELDDELRAVLYEQVERIMASEPVLVGFSVMFLDQLNFSLALAKQIRARMGAEAVEIVLGGASMLALNAGELLQACPYIDGIMLGEGENGLTALLSGVEKERVPGLLYRDENGISANNRAADTIGGSNLNVDYSPFDLKSYFNPESVLTVLFSRDCQWGRCRFCAHNFTFSGYCKRSVTEFVDELERLNRLHCARFFYFADQYISAEDLELIAKEILARELKIAYHVMCRPLASYHPGRLETIARSGCRWISWGIESGSQRLLNLVKKGTRVKDIEILLKNAAEVGISNLAMMIFGLPTSSDVDLWQTFGFLDRVQENLDAIKASSYVLYDNTWLAVNHARVGITVTGVQKLLEINGNSIHSTKLTYREKAADGQLRPPCSSLEIIQWQRRRAWWDHLDFYDKLPCEHYLLYAHHKYEIHGAPDKPLNRSA